MVAAHVPDGVQSGNDPKKRRDQCEQEAHRFDLEPERNAGQNLQDRVLRPQSILDRTHELKDQQEKDSRRADAYGIPDIGPLTESEDSKGPHERQADRDADDHLRNHGAMPINERAALSATSAVNVASIPK